MNALIEKTNTHNEIVESLKKFEYQKNEREIKRGELKELLENISEEHKIGISAVKSIYYNQIKGKCSDYKREDGFQKETVGIHRSLLFGKTPIRTVLLRGAELLVLNDVADGLSFSVSSAAIVGGVSESDIARLFLKTGGEPEEISALSLEGVTALLEHASSSIEFSGVRNEATSLQRFMESHFSEFKMPQSDFKYDERFAQTRGSRKPPFAYKAGDIVSVRVINIADFGVFVETIDEHKYYGLIHISEVKDGFVTDLHLYFREEDVLNAKIKKITSTSRVEFSTKGLPNAGRLLSVPTNHLAPLNVSAYRPPSPRIVANAAEDVEELAKPSSAALDASIKPEAQPVAASEPYDKDLNEIVSYLNGLVGALSPKAKSMLTDLIFKHGIFKFSLAAFETSKDFENDLGVMFLSDVKNKLEDGL